jgi:hypothetical protein
MFFLLLLLDDRRIWIRNTACDYSCCYGVQVEREEEKREKRVLDNWKRLLRGLAVRARIQAKYMKQQ